MDLNRGLAVYKNDSLSYVHVIPKEYYELGKKKDTLILDIKRNEESKTSSDYIVSCRNCSDIVFKQESENDSLYYTFSFGQDHVKFLITYEQIPHGLMTSPINEGLVRDTTIGFIRLKNTFVHYSSILVDESLINIAVIDKNFNGSLDDIDLISLSNDNYFQTVESSKSNTIKNVEVFNINGKLFRIKVIDKKNFIISLEPAGKKTVPAISFYSSIQNTKINGKPVSEYLESKPYLVIFYWGDRYNDYKGDFSTLNKLQEKAEVIGIYDSQKVPNHVLAYAISEKLTIVPFTGDLKGGFDLSGYPSFMLIDKDGIVVSDVNDVSKIIEQMK